MFVQKVLLAAAMMAGLVTLNPGVAEARGGGGGGHGGGGGGYHGGGGGGHYGGGGGHYGGGGGHYYGGGGHYSGGGGHYSYGYRIPYGSYGYRPYVPACAYWNQYGQCVGYVNNYYRPYGWR